MLGSRLSDYHFLQNLIIQLIINCRTHYVGTVRLVGIACAGTSLFHFGELVFFCVSVRTPVSKVCFCQQC